jgi:hypothetical protein
MEGVDDGGMTPFLLALILFAAPPEPGMSSWGGRISADRMYQACVPYAAHVGRPTLGEDERACMIAAAIMMGLNDAEDRAGVEDRTVCLPEAVLRAEGTTGSPLAEAFIAYVDRNPASRALDANHVFLRAIAEKWPCPH